MPGMCLICALLLKKCLAVCLTMCLVPDARRHGLTVQPGGTAAGGLGVNAGRA